MHGDHFEVFNVSGRWHWRLYGGHYPSGAIAYSRPEGYSSRADALSSIESAQKAAVGAKGRPVAEVDVPANYRSFA